MAGTLNGDTASPVSRAVPAVTLRSVQAYKSHDEYVLVMKEDLAEWLNELYDMTMTADDLFDKLDTGILLCRYACIVDDAMKSRCESVVYRERGVEPGSFQARVNVAAFLAWCRRSPLKMTDDVLFETGDLICQRSAERNERQVALCLLEVGRRSAALKLGLPAPQLVRLEAEIDAEILAGDNSDHSQSSSRRGSSKQGSDEVDNDNEEESPLNSPTSTSRSSAGRTRTIKPPNVIVRNVAEGPVSADDDVSSESIKYERRGQDWQRHRFRPVIPVDMMSLDEMVRQILARCTCANQYPMIRVSEGKYRIGDNLTLIFVRILRQHVMVRIGGGWNTLDNYLARCDPCRKSFASAAVSPTAASTSGAFSGSGQSATFIGEAEQQRQMLADNQLNSTVSDELQSPSLTSATTTNTTSGQQKPTVRHLSDLSLTSQVFPVDKCCNPPTARYSDMHDDVTQDSAAANESNGACSQTVLSTPSRRTSVLPSPSSSPSLATCSSPVDVTCSCRRLMSAGRSSSWCNRPSRIPVPLRVASQCRSHSTTINHGHRRCDSGVDLNLSSPDLE